MTELGGVGVQIFEQAAEFWKTSQPAELSPLAVEHLEATLAYAKEHPKAVAERAQQLDTAIVRFNEQREKRTFKSDEVNSKKLAEQILAPKENLPTLPEMPSSVDSRAAYFSGLANLIRYHYYTFVDKLELEDPKMLITGLLVDGYGFALRAKRAVEHKRTNPTGHDDLIIVNAICEMVQRGTLQTEMYLANWYKPDFGLSQDFCNRIKRQFGDLKPLVGQKNSS